MTQTQPQMTKLNRSNRVSRPYKVRKLKEPEPNLEPPISRAEARVLRKKGMKAYAGLPKTRTFLVRECPTPILWAAQQRAYRARVPFRDIFIGLIKLYADGRIDVPLGQPGFPSGKPRNNGHVQQPSGWYQPAYMPDSARDETLPAWEVVIPGERPDVSREREGG
jgi:hypothetical protein